MEKVAGPGNATVLTVILVSQWGHLKASAPDRRVVIRAGPSDRSRGGVGAAGRTPGGDRCCLGRVGQAEEP